MLNIPPRVFVRADPVMSTRIVLRPLDLDDAMDMHLAVEECRTYLAPWLPWVPSHTTQDDANAFLEAATVEWDEGRALRFTFRERGTDVLLGGISLETCVHSHQSCELGYWIREVAQGRGLMTEAAATILRFAFERTGMHRVRVAAATSNHKSLAVIGRLGFRFEGIARDAEFCAGRWLDHAVFGMLASDFGQAG